jgi:hypothetical protein
MIGFIYPIIANNKDDYVKARQIYKDSQYVQDFDLIIKCLNKYIECAKKVGKWDIVAWQYNNIAHYNIQEFINRADYENRMEILNKMKDGSSKKLVYKAETQKLFLSEIKLIDVADKNIKLAEDLDGKYPDIKGERSKVIKNNKKFVKQILLFCEIKKLTQ